MSATPGTQSFEIRDLTPEDKHWAQRVLQQYWASTEQVTRGKKLKADELPGIVAVRDGAEVGLLTYNIEGDACEIVTHNSMAGHGGIGSCLLTGVRNKAREHGCKRLWCVTTNDNTPAMRFYQRRDFDIVAFHKNAVNEARKLKPEIPDVGLDGIPIRHEIEMEYML
tara:strand:+ start:394874 stop:395374 length:501 start_codon:yes stop_codon:yes gene_type:complete